MAVGSQETAHGSYGLAESWNGASWKVRATPTAFIALSGVSCRSGMCVAVGSPHVTQSIQARPLAERWNGQVWAITPTPAPAGGLNSELTAVSCISPTSCRAAGTHLIGGADEVVAAQDSSLYEAFNGSSWSITAAVDPGGAILGQLNGVSCVSASTCVAVGRYGIATESGFADVWNGSAWKLTTVPKSVHTLAAVSCSSSSACMAVGENGALRWNGSTWTSLAMPATTGAQLMAVSCRTATRCVAVGAIIGNGVTPEPYAEQWNGTTWAITATPQMGTHGLLGVSCWASNGCLAVGPSSLALAWDGSTWIPITTPATTGNLTSVSCPAVKTCIAVGSDATGPRWAQWDGTTWTTGAMISPASSSFIEPTAISCTDITSCVSVGGYCDSVSGCQNGSSFPETDHSLTETWNGAWTLAITPAPTHSIMDSLTSVSCPTSTTCMSVGWMFRTFQMPYGLRGS